MAKRARAVRVRQSVTYQRCVRCGVELGRGQGKFLPGYGWACAFCEPRVHSS